MTETLKESTPPLADTTNVLPILSENKGSLSLSLTIDKSVSKVATWVIGIIVGNSILVGASIVLAVWMIVSYQHAEREARMQQYYLLELDAKFIAAGLKKPEEAISKKQQEK